MTNILNWISREKSAVRKGKKELITRGITKGIPIPIMKTFISAPG
jgi:hypothetical protein